MDVILRLLAVFPLRQPVWALPLRLVVGFGFIQHGYAKLARGPGSFAGILHALGMPFPDLLAWATITVELAGGLAVMLGLFIPLAAAPMVVVLLVAIVSVHLPNGFSSIKLLGVTETGAHFGQPGYETDLLYIVCLAALVAGGPGPFAMDALWRRRNKKTQEAEA
jgi:putative oxidoreductase